MKTNETTMIAKLIGLGRVTVELKGKRETFKKVVSVSGAFANAIRDDGTFERIYKRDTVFVVETPEINFSKRAEPSGKRLTEGEVKAGDRLEWTNGIGGTETAKVFKNAAGDLVVSIFRDRELKVRILLGINNGARIVKMKATVKQNAQSRPDKAGRWYVTWSGRRFYGAVFERDGEWWFQEVPNYTSEPPMIIRDDGGKWEVAPDRLEDAKP